MNDLQICKRIADIEGVHYMETRHDKNNFLALVSENDFTGTPPEMIGKYNPLTDDGLCFRLMVKYGLTFNDENDMYGVASCKYSDEYLCVNESPNKAICLAIIAAHKDV